MREFDESQFREKKGQTNVYECQACGLQTVTVNADSGVTPFSIHCGHEGCPGEALSTFYRKQPRCYPMLEWYRPDEAEYGHLSAELREHVDNGGLLQRKASIQASEDAGFRFRFA